jgi:gliding motility-associated-like protein
MSFEAKILQHGSVEYDTQYLGHMLKSVPWAWPGPGRITSLVMLLFIVVPLQAQEICNNGIDDNGNGLVDLNDAECVCADILNPGSVTSFFPNHRFEQRTNCCPVSFSHINYSSLWCLSGWSQVTAGTSDFCHPCGFYPPSFPSSPDGGGYVGFIAQPGYFEYVGNCIPAGLMDAGVEYTLSMWILGASVGVQNPGTIILNNGPYYQDPLPLTIYGHPTCLWTPDQTVDCLENFGWTELATVDYHATGAWQRINITFSSPFNVLRLAFGGGCDMPTSYAAVPETEDHPRFNPYFLVDELMLNVASAFVTLPVAAEGGVCSGDLLLTATPPAVGSGFQWYHEGVAIVGATSLTLQPGTFGLGAGVYSFTCDVEGQCLKGWVTVPGPALVPDISIGPEEGCVPLTVTFIENTHTDGSTVEWWFGDGGEALGDTVEHIYTTPGIYDLRVVVNPPDGCVLDSTFIAAVTAHPLPQVTFTASPQPVYVGNTNVTLQDATTGVIMSWQWDLDSIPPYFAEASQVEVVLPDVPGSYPVSLMVTDANGCVGTANTDLIVLDEGLPEMPNVFSPNGDGSNDVFAPLGNWTGTGKLEIHNRWGQLIFSTDAPAGGWDGRVNGSYAPDGTYYYILTVFGSEVSTGSGHFQLLR